MAVPADERAAPPWPPLCSEHSAVPLPHHAPVARSAGIPHRAGSACASADRLSLRAAAFGLLGPERLHRMHGPGSGAASALEFLCEVAEVFHEAILRAEIANAKAEVVRERRQA